jgi:hypothetical protein
MTEAEYLPVKVVVTDALGAYEVDADKEIMVTVNTEKSTAVLGEHFAFESDENFALVYEGMSEGELYLEILKIEEGKDKIVLRLEEPEEFGIGNYFEVEIRFVSYWEKLAGKWQINEVISTAEFMESMGWWCMMNGWSEDEVYADLPAFNEADALEIVITDANTGKLKPSFQSNFKNYFIGESNLTKGENHDVFLDPLSFPPITTNTRIAICDNVNRYFHATEKSEDTTAYVGFRVITDAVTGEELLDMYVIDHTSKSFMPELLECGFLYDTKKPVAAMIGVYLNATFKRQPDLI